MAARLALSAAALRDAVMSRRAVCRRTCAIEIARRRRKGAGAACALRATGVPTAPALAQELHALLPAMLQDFQCGGARRRLPRTAAGQRRQIWCAFVRSTRRRRRCHPRCSRALRSTRRKPTLRQRWRPRQARQCDTRAGAGLDRQGASRQAALDAGTQLCRRHGARTWVQGGSTMIRVVTFLLAVAVLAAGFVWVADRPGDVAITWMGYRIETSVMVAALAIAALVIVLMTLWTIVRAILRSPEQVSLLFRHRRAAKGYLAITRGLIAIGAGDLRSARKSADEAAQAFARRSARSAAHRAIGADGRRPQRRRARLPRDDAARRYQAAWLARSLHRSAAARRRAGRAARRRGGRQGVAGTCLGRTGGARLSLRRRRLVAARSTRSIT